MSIDFEEQLTRTLEGAAERAPLPAGDPVAAVRMRQRRSRRRRAGIAVACVVAATAAVLVGTRLAVPSPNPAPAPEYVFAPDRIPDFTDLPGPDKVWPNAVHRLPAKLPDGYRYSVVAVLGDDRYLVTRGLFNGEPAPSVFNTRTGTVTALGTSAVTDGLAMSRVLMARELNGKAVWFLEGSRNNRFVREAWVAPLDGSSATRLANLPDGSAPRFSPSGNGIIWEYQTGQTWKSNIIRRVSLSGGPVGDIPRTLGFEVANIAPWITKRTSNGKPNVAGELRDVANGKRLRWTAAPGLQDVRCGPTWCTGIGTGDHIAVQALDGSDVVELPVRGMLSPTRNGRLAVGYIERPDAAEQVVWDRTTGRAATMLPRRPSDPLSSATQQNPTADEEPEVLTVTANGNELVVLDLRAIG